jgi:hypothetical protein
VAANIKLAGDITDIAELKNVKERTAAPMVVISINILENTLSKGIADNSSIDPANIAIAGANISIAVAANIILDDGKAAK